ncbi:hypothetical protein ACFLQY_02380 [Verrucomicrobiota bacterium]
MKNNIILYSLALGVISGSILGQTAAGHWVTTCGILLLLIAIAIGYRKKKGGSP